MGLAWTTASNIVRSTPANSGKKGLARMNAPNPLTRSDARCRRSFYYGSRVAVPTLTPVPAPAPRGRSG